MPNDQDLFMEEKTMVTMSFGDHIEELRVRLILALLGLFFGLVVVFLPPLDIAWWVMKSMERPAKLALDDYYRAEYEKKAKQAQADESVTPRLQATVEADTFITELKKLAPKLELPQSDAVKGQTLVFAAPFSRGGHDRVQSRVQPCRSTRAWSHWLRSKRSPFSSWSVW